MLSASIYMNGNGDIQKNLTSIEPKKKWFGVRGRRGLSEPVEE